MPGFKTHYFFGTEAKKHITLTESEQFLTDYPKSYQLGLQGPDLFFYYLPLYIFYKHNIGNLMHESQTLAFFRAMIEARNHMPHKKDRMIADAYICGFIGHYSLDTVVHPYVYYRTNHNAHTDDGNVDFMNHVFLETDIDNAVCRRITHLRPTQFAPGDTIRLSQEEHRVIRGLLNRALKKTFPSQKPTKYFIGRSMAAMRVEQDLMHDPSGRKKALVRRLEECFLKHAFISTQIPSDTLEFYTDPCNLRHRRWKNPFEANGTAKIQSEDVYQLMALAEKDYIRRIHEYSQAMYPAKEDSEEEIFHRLNVLYEDLGDNSYCSGYPLAEA